MIFHPGFVKNLDRFPVESTANPSGYVIYGGDKDFIFEEKYKILPFPRV